MIKRAFLVLAMLAAATVAHAAGTVPGFSLAPQFDTLGRVMPGCKLYVIKAGTVNTPQIAYQDSGLSIPSPGGSTLTCDSSGRLPQFFVADGLIKLRLTDKNSNQVFVGDNLLVVGPSAGGGGGGTIDPTTILQTGDMKVSYGTGSLEGFVRLNGRTIGSASSGATERANADTQALFSYLWNVNASLAVSGGRGASAAADWAANKTIALPDWRGRAIAGLDNMGNTASGRLTSSYFGSDATVLGASGGAESITLDITQIPSHSHGAVVNDPGHSHSYTKNTGLASGPGGTGNYNTGEGTGTTGANTTGIGVSITNNGGGLPHRTVPPTMLATIYIKL